MKTILKNWFIIVLVFSQNCTANSNVFVDYLKSINVSCISKESTFFILIPNGQCANCIKWPKENTLLKKNIILITSIIQDKVPSNNRTYFDTENLMLNLPFNKFNTSVIEYANNKIIKIAYFDEANKAFEYCLP